MRKYRIEYRGGIGGVLVVALSCFVVVLIPFAIMLLPTMYELVPKEIE
jgi:hypothetical protein